LDLKELLTDILHAVTGIELLNVEPKGLIYVIEDDSLRLAAHMGLSEEVVAVHRDVDPRLALCMSTTRRGRNADELLFCRDPRRDCAYAATCANGLIKPHIIVPLRAHNETTGIMCLYPKGHAPFDIETSELMRTIANQIGIAVDNAKLYEKTRVLSLHDPLTGLPNRRFLSLEIERNFMKAQRYNTPLSVLMLDIDQFKTFNDMKGHIAGDALIVDIARIILKEVREADLAVRYGGEEFLVLLPEASFQQAFDIAERIRVSIAEKTPVTISIGVSSFASEMKDYSELINDADRALYQAKAFGRNRVEGVSRQMRLPID
ncbi:MAG TPA: sensor domain-containing diguanylate cyclase, partial [Dissulfurispiraceae bacterium]|nr:sensor domain-containing diguanylate cyclase [Dissulfurispiraceae bacterium]